MKTRRPTFLAINIILLIIAGVLTLYFATKVAQVEREAKAQDMGKYPGKMKEKFNAPTLKKNKKKSTKKLPKKAKEKGDKLKKNNPLAEYQLIMDKNLFRPLGWGGDKPNNPFKLVGTVIDSSSQKAKAIITRAGNPETFFVSEGDIIGNGYKVEEISANKVKLANAENGENFVMQFGWAPLVGKSSKGSSRGNSGRSGQESTKNRSKNRKPSAGKGKGKSRDSGKSTGKGTLSKQAIEAWTALKQSSAWRNASPEQRKQMGQDLKSGLGGKGGSSDSGGRGK